MVSDHIYIDRELPPYLAELFDESWDVVGPDMAGLPTCRAAIAGSSRWDAERMDQAPELKVISRSGIGFDTVDLDAAADGYTQQSGRIYEESGRLCALSRQCMAYFEQ